MSNIDNRIVKMTFDNSQFEKNAATSLSTLEKLKTSLNFSGASKGIQELQDSVNQVDMSPLEQNVQTIADKFDAMGVVAFTVFQNITNEALEAGKKLLSAITIDPLKMGLEEYETQINAIQTIMANTQAAFKEQGFTEEQQMDAVNEKLDELNAYADKTIYNFTEMTRNIGTFTAAGVDLDTATNAIQGFSNAAAISGAGSADAARGMYQLSQALSAGVVKLRDWISIENANMGGQVFKDQLLDTARTHGIAVDEMIETNGSFRDSLTEGWLTADVMTETLEKFTATTEGLTEAEIEQNREMWRARGYTEEQIDSIFELGKTATDAATKVKTFSQLIDTLKEALQSGWTQSWEYIIGDFNQAKELWSGIYNTLEAYINASSDARNEMLKEWSESENGRAALIEGLANAFKALLSVISPIKQAFDDIFGGLNAGHLIAFSSGLRDFTANLILNEEQMTKLKNGFSGIFKVLHGLISIITSPLQGAFSVVTSVLGLLAPTGNVALEVFSTFGSVLSSFGSVLEFVGSLLRNLFSGVGDIIYVAVGYIRHFFEIITEHIDLSPISNFFNGFDNGVTSLNIHLANAMTAMNGFFKSLRNDVDSGEFKLFDILAEKIQNLKETIKETLPNLSETFSSIGASITDYFTIPEGVMTKPKNLYHNLLILKESLESDIEHNNFLAKINEYLNNIKETLSSGFSNNNFLASLEGILNNLKDKFSKIAPIIKEKIDQIRGSLANLVKGTAEEATKYEGLDLVGVLGIGGAIIGVKKLIGLFKNLKGGDKESGGILDSLTEIKDSVVDTFGEIQNTLKASTLVAIAVAIGIMALSLKEVATIPTENLLGGMGAITVLILGMKTVMTSIGKLDTTSVAQMIGITASLVLFSFSVKELAEVVKAIGDLSMESLLKGITVVTILSAEMVAVAKLLSKEKSSLASAGVGLIEFAAAILILTEPIKILGAMDREALKQGMSAVAILTVALGGMAALVGKSNFGASAGAGLMEMAIALYMMYGAVILFAHIEWDTFVSGLQKLGAVMLALAGSAFIVGISGFNASSGAGLIGMAISLYVLYGAIKMYAAMDLGEFASGMIKVAIALGIMAAAAFAIGRSGLSVDDALAFIAIGAAITILAFGISLLAGLPTVAVAASLAILLVALLAFGVVATVLAPAAPVLMQFAIAIGIFALSATLIAGALLLLVVALGAFGAAIIGFIATATTLVDPMLKAFTDFINASAEGIRNNQDQLLDAIGNLLMAFGEMILNAFSKIGEWFNTTVIPWVIENGPAIVQGLIDGIVGLASGLAAGAAMLFEEFCKGMDAFWPWLQENGPAIVQGLIDGIVGFLVNFGETVGKLFEEFCKAMDQFWPWLAENGPKIVTDLVKGIGEALWHIGEAAGDIIDDLVKGIGEGFDDMLEAGGNLVQGFINGITSMPGQLWDAACGLANDAWNAITSTLDEHSPSRLTFGGGENFTLGLINGILSLKSKAVKETEGLALAVFNALDTNIDTDYSPTITPVMDLTNIQNGIGSMNSMFDSIPNTYGINGSIDAQKLLNNQAMISLGNGADYGSIIEVMHNIQSDLAKYSEIMSKLNIVMDTGTLVGQLTPGIDRQLGRNAMMAGRGVM